MSGAHDGPQRERRFHPALRAQVEDLLASIRSAASRDAWTAAERTQHEIAMARIMERVREHALARGRSNSTRDEDGA